MSALTPFLTVRTLLLLAVNESVRNDIERVVQEARARMEATQGDAANAELEDEDDTQVEDQTEIVPENVNDNTDERTTNTRATNTLGDRISQRLTRVTRAPRDVYVPTFNIESPNPLLAQQYQDMVEARLFYCFRG